jgi:hypothetical protein
MAEPQPGATERGLLAVSLHEATVTLRNPRCVLARVRRSRRRDTSSADGFECDGTFSGVLSSEILTGAVGGAKRVPAAAAVGGFLTLGGRLFRFPSFWALATRGLYEFSSWYARLVIGLVGGSS